MIAIWLGAAPPARTLRWLDGALAVAARLGGVPGGGVTAVAAGDPAWLELAAERAHRAGVAAAVVPTELSLDYLGWAQVMAAAARQLDATTIRVDEASRPERFPEVAAIAELLDAAQLTHVVALVADGPVLQATRAAGGQLQACRVRGPAVIGVRIAGPPSEDEAPPAAPPQPPRRLELPAIGLDPVVLGHRAVPPRIAAAPRRSAERVAELLGVHVAPRAPARPPREP